jgi:glutamine amidotransferase
MIVVADYGMGNLHSVQKALERVGAKVKISQRPDDIRNADKVVLPGVGAFDEAADCLKRTGVWDAILDVIHDGVPTLGICLGMQLLFEGSEEGEKAGLSVLPGKVKLFPSSMKVPHMGWNVVTPIDCPILGDKPFYAYFVHSFYAPQGEYMAGRTEYSLPFASVVQKGSLVATQFHPEKSGKAGLEILRRFAGK